MSQANVLPPVAKSRALLNVFSPVAALLLLRADPLGRGAMLAAPLGAFILMVSSVIGQHTRLTQQIGPTSASLRPRLVRDYLPRRLATVVGSGLVVSLVLLPLFAAAGSADDMGRAGRSLHYSCGAITGARGPWPGSFYVLPLGLALIVSVLTALVGMKKVVSRPRLSTDPTDPGSDDVRRLRSAASIFSLLGIIVFVPLSGTSFFAAIVLFGSRCGSQSKSVLTAGLVGICLFAVFGAGYCVIAGQQSRKLRNE
jgi:hypothetical protein